MNLTGKVAIVTGSGRGIGRAIALKLAETGAGVVVNDVGDPEPANKTVDEIKALGVPSMAVMADISVSAEAERLAETVKDNYGKIDILVNNAGITRDQLLLRMSEEDWDKVLSVNLKGVFLCSKAVLRYMIKQRWGRIVNIASIVGVLGNPGQANYSASKAGIIGLTRTLAKEVGSRKVTVNAVAPGFIDTGMTQKLDEAWKKELMSRIPLGSVGSPRDVAEAVAFLASEEAAYITGQVLNVDGGVALGWM